MMEMFCILTVNVNILVVMLYYGFPWCYHWGRLGKEYTGSLHVISYNCVQSPWFENFFYF